MTISKLNELYFSWLYQMIWYNYKHLPISTQYTQLVLTMWTRPYIWMVANDDNRVEDGLELRYEFLQQHAVAIRVNTDLEFKFRQQPCSFLEVLIGLSRRLAFNESGNPQWWAWRLIKNLDLHEYRNPLPETVILDIRDALDVVIWRTYKWDGTGGFFPLAFPKEDQTKVELWYQMNAYMEELDHH